MEKNSVRKGISGPLLVGMLCAASIGLISYFMCRILKYPGADPLIISLCFGIIIRSFIKKRTILITDFNVAVTFFIPLGIFFYGIKNLDFVTITHLNLKIIIILSVVLLIYFGVIILCGKVFHQTKPFTYLIASGSAICGASAITITASALDSKSEDISTSLLSVTLAGLFATFLLLPFCASILNINNDIYALLTGSILQFTGFVKVAVSDSAFIKKVISLQDMASVALTIKATRYLVLLISIPVFCSILKKRVVVPFTMVSFLVAGITGTLLRFYIPTVFTDNILPFITPVYSILWSIAMATVGLETDISQFISDKGTKGMIMAFAGLLSVTAVFLIGIKLINLL